MRKAFAVVDEFPEPYPSDRVRRELKIHVKDLRQKSSGVIKRWRESVQKQSAGVKNRIGENFNKQKIVADLQTTIDTAKQFGLKGEVTSGRMQTLLESFRVSAASDCLKHIRTIEDASDDGSLLSSLSQLDTDTLGILTEFVETASEYIAQTKAEAEERTKNWDSAVVENEKNAVDSLFAEIQFLIQQSLGGTE